MASEDIIDFQQIDTSEVCVDHASLYEILPHGGRFRMIDGIVHHEGGEGIALGYKDITAGDWWAEDHIPGRPIFPGVLMVEAGAQLCSWEFSTRGIGVGGKFFGFGGVNRTRFRGMVQPETRLWIACKLHRARRTMFSYYVEGYITGEDGLSDTRRVFETEIIGAAL
jgi:3-hydroxyacyl-[acyl-carrier-protein] dehydratase